MINKCEQKKEAFIEESILKVAAGSSTAALASPDINQAYRSIFENNGCATVIFEEDTTISLVNAKFEQLSHYSKDEIEGKKSWTEFIVKDDLDRLMGYHRLRGIHPEAAPDEFEAKVIDRNGVVHPVNLTISILPESRKRVASLTDLTSFKTVEEALRKSEANYQVLFENAGVAIAHVDFKGNFLNANDTFLKFIGYSREDLEEVNAFQITHPDYVEETRKLEAKQISGQINEFTQEKYYVCKNGELRWGQMRSSPIRDEQGRLLSAVVAIIDRTRRKKAEEALVKSEALYRSLFENSPIGMFQTNFPTGRFLRVNSAYANMLGYASPEELMSKISDVTPIHVNPENRQAINNTLEKQDWFYGEYPRYRKDGSIMIGKVAIRRILNPDGTINCLEGIVEDITEQKKAKEALVESENELRLRAQELLEANMTMKVLLKTMEKDQIELKESILTNIREQVLPSLEKLKKTQLNDLQKGCIEIAEACLDEIASPFIRILTSRYLNLTKRETMIASLIKEGRTSKEIAELINVSKRDIDYHRGKIRKKLGLKNQKSNLQILLRNFS